MSGNRFWEFYLVRYLLGTIFGVLILIFLVVNYSTQITESFYIKGGAEKDIKTDIKSLLFETTFGMKKSDASIVAKLFNNDSNNFERDNTKEEHLDFVEVRQVGLSILATIILVIAGFLYMYFSSMIILLLHSLRVVFFNSGNSSQQQGEKDRNKVMVHIGKYLNYYLLFFTVFSFLAPYLFGVRSEACNHIFSILIVISVTGVFLKEANNIRDFYVNLSQYRAISKGTHATKIGKIETSSEIEFHIRSVTKQDDKESETKELLGVNEYVESYRHLREHGNAFGIIVCELLFAFWLIEWSFSPWAIFYWCLIGFIAWIIGTYLEVNRSS
ncbi:membrane protease YdiL (CAAX protease family) [Paenibacillus sp. PastF-3]|uniref:hypothetical protein n=1 Tax=Paenibacillus sp. PastF-3 TaxID=2940626 RepID=UPI002476453B|nr:hypothetical protein [Paenibacillus sp. PastF-3]MDH6374935.1 membrane protease YdiL (CAAX protease family) [Paenibacillus sp. PastF-3]